MLLLLLIGASGVQPVVTDPRGHAYAADALVQSAYAADAQLHDSGARDATLGSAGGNDE